MASNDEITKAIKQINKYHNKIIILHCVSSYPTKLKDIKLHKIKEFREKFKTNLIGLSDHTNGITSSLISLAYGTVAIEKHFKIDDKFKTADSSFSITPNQLKQLKLESSQVFESFKKKNSNSAETISLGLRRSIFAKKKIAKNSKLTTDNIETLRPYIGICASKYFKVLGKKVKRNLKVGDPIFEKYLL
jgi:sialic acid synthase SpsE